MTKSELKQLIYEVIGEMYSDTSYKTQKGYDEAKKKIESLKDELKKIQDLMNQSHYNDTNDPQARNYHLRRLKEIPKLISVIRQKVLGFTPVKENNDAELAKWLEKRLGKTMYRDESQRDRLMQLLAKLKKSNTGLKEVKGYVFGPMETANNWISTNAKPKMKNGTKKWVVSAADFQKAFPTIQMKELPTKPIKYSDYYIVDNEGDLIKYSQANVGSGLD